MTLHLEHIAGAAAAPQEQVTRLLRRAVWGPPLAVVLALLVLLAVGDWLICTEVRRHAQGLVDRRAEVLAHSLREQLRSRVGEVSTLVRSPLLRSRDRTATADAIRTELNWLVGRSDAYVWIGWTDPSGRVLVGSRGWLEGRSIAERPVFAQALHTPFLGDVHPAVALAPLLRAQRGALATMPQLIDLGLPVLDANGALLGVLTVHLDPARLLEVALPAALPSREPYPLEVQLVAGSPPRPLPVQGPDVGPAWVVPEAASAASPAVAGAASGAAAAPRPPWLNDAMRQVSPTVDAAGETWFLGLRRLEGLSVGALPWRVLVGTRESAVEAVVWRLALGAGAMGLLVAAMVGFVAWRVAQRIARPWEHWFKQALQHADAAGMDTPRPWGSLVDELGASPAVAPLAERPLAAVADEPRLPEQAFNLLARDAWQLKQVVDQLPVGLALADPHLRILYANKSYQAQTGESVQALLGTPLNLALAPPTERGAHLERLHALEQQPAVLFQRCTLPRATGEALELEWQVRPLRNAAGAVVGFLSLVSDMTNELGALREAIAKGHRLRLYADAVQDAALVMLDAGGRVVDWNEGARRVKGYAPAQAIGLPLERFFPAEDVADGLPDRLLDEVRRSGRASMEGWHVRADGSRFWSRGFLYRMPAEAAPAAIAMITRDMTASHEADLRLEEQRAALQALAQRLLVQEKETTRHLAQTLHDELGQTLAALRLNADLLLPRLGRCLTPGGADGGPGGDAPAARNLQRVDQLIDQANQQVRGALKALRPTLIDERGLWAALDDELQRGVPAAADAVALRLEAEPALELQRWPAEVEYAAFMVAREAVFNAVRHAQAHEVVVQLRGDGRRLELTVRDDGTGLPEGAQAGKPGHLGLVGMHERAQAIGAALLLLSVPDHGTTVVLTWPKPD